MKKISIYKHGSNSQWEMFQNAPMDHEGTLYVPTEEFLTKLNVFTKFEPTLNGYFDHMYLYYFKA